MDVQKKQPRHQDSVSQPTTPAKQPGETAQRALLLEALRDLLDGCSLEEMGEIWRFMRGLTDN